MQRVLMIVILCGDHHKSQQIELQLAGTQGVLIRRVSTIDDLRKSVLPQYPDLIVACLLDENITVLRNEINIDNVPIYRLTDNLTGMSAVIEFIEYLKTKK